MSRFDPRQLAALEQAAQWRATLGDEAAGPAEVQAWQVWLQADEQHQWAWQQVERVHQRWQQVPGRLAGRTLALAAQRPVMGRRGVLKGLLLLAGSGGLGWVGYRQLHEGAWLADYHTAVGERRTVRLADGSQVQLNTATALDVRFDASQRLLQLRTGEVLIDTAKDPAGRPFLVRTGQGTLQALGTRFLVRSESGFTHLAVFESQVRVQADRQGPGALLKAGEQCRFISAAEVLDAPLQAEQDAWTRGVLIANDQRLDSFVAELARYRKGWLRCAPEVAGLRISGTFRLDDTDQVLAALASALPVRIVQRTPYWVTVAAR
ncbi:FecR domain-containing protein [Pseudomonas sp. X10]